MSRPNQRFFFRLIGRSAGVFGLFLACSACASLRLEPAAVALLVPPDAPLYAVLDTTPDPALWLDLAKRSGVPPELRDRVRQVVLCADPSGQPLVLVQGDFPYFFTVEALKSSPFRVMRSPAGRVFALAENGAAVAAIRDGLIAYAPGGQTGMAAYLDWQTEAERANPGGRSSSGPQELFAEGVNPPLFAVLADVAAQIPNLTRFRFDVRPGPVGYRLTADLSVASGLSERQARSAARLLVLQALQAIGLSADLSAATVEFQAGSVRISEVLVGRSELLTAVTSLVQDRGLR